MYPSSIKLNTCAMKLSRSLAKCVTHACEEDVRRWIQLQVNVLMNNAGISKGKDGKVGTSFENLDAWKDVLDVNLGGVDRKSVV